MNDTIV